MEIYTIGFTQKSAERFFGILREAGIKRLVDVRVNNRSQLAGFAKRDDLAYFLEALCGAEYRHLATLSPTKELMQAYKKKEMSWGEYERRYTALLEERKAAEVIDKNLFDMPAVLLCSEPTAAHCHRRLAAEYLQARWGDVAIVHL